jgi:phosphoribosylformylglycinamidine (FGAM) synthase PurS component
LHYRARLLVYPKRGISDPEGEALHNRLRRKGLTEISQVRSGKYWEVYFEAESREAALSYLEKVYLSPPMVNPVKDDPQLLALEEAE